jgi:hypothetical protein
MTSQSGTHDRVLGVWGARAYQWSGEERPRAAGFPIDPSGRQRVLGFPADPPGAGHGWFRRHARPELEPAQRRRLIVAVVAILPGEGKQGQDRGH